MSDEPKELCSNSDTCDWCGAYSTTDRCSGCMEARYCGKRCQASHWAEHKGLCLQIRAEREKKERHAQTIDTMSACGYCQVVSAVALLLCGGCGKVKYCDKECQRAHWNAGGHKLHCKEMKAAGEVPAPGAAEKPGRGRQQQQQQQPLLSLRSVGDNSYECLTGTGGKVECVHRSVALLWGAKNRTNLPGYHPVNNPMLSVSHSAQTTHAPTSSILEKWRKQKFFVRFLDGDTLNGAVVNLVLVTLSDALAHDDWTVDWDVNLTNEECALVKSENWSVDLLFK